MRKRILAMFVAFFAVISLASLPSCGLLDEVAVDTDGLDQYEDVTGLLGSDNGGLVAGEGTGAALKIAETVTVVDVSKAAVAAKPASGFSGALQAASALGATTDYGVALANQEVWVEDRANEAFDMATMILCYMGELGHEEMVNQGAYLALVDTNKCESKDSSDNASSGLQESQSGSSASGEATSINYERWVVVSFRREDTSPQNVRFWVEGGKDQQEGTIEARLIIWETKSADNPLGLFKLNFQEVDSAGAVTMKGYLEAAKTETSDEVQLRFIMDASRTECFGAMTMLQAGTLVRDTDADGAFTGTGKGRAHSTIDYPANIDFSTCGGPEKPGSGTAGARNEGGGGGGGPPPADVKFTMAYNTDYFKRKGEMTPMNIDISTMTGSVGTATSGEVCLDRANPDESAWRYGLFADENATVPGKALQVNSGFPIVWGASGAEKHGYVGYWGLWDPTGALAHGDTVTEEVWGDTSAGSYTIFKGGGRLTKHTKQTMTLAELLNVDLISGMEVANPDYVEGSTEPDKSSQSSWKQVILQWRGDSKGMMIVGEVDEQNWQPVYYASDTSTTTVESAFTPGQDDWNIWFWSEALGGGGYVELKADDGADNIVNVTLSGTSTAIFHMSSVVAPGDTAVPATLACFNDCPDGAAINTATPYNANSTWESMWKDDGTPLATHFEVANNGYWDPTLNSNAGGWVAGADFDAADTDNGGLIPGTNFAAYTFDTTAYQLKDGSSVNVERTEEPAGDPGWGVWTGPMVDLSVQANRTLLACDWDATKVCTWKLNNADTYYTWETGTQEWNKFSGLKNADSSFVKFDPPFKVTYKHTFADASTGTYVLEYGGYGDLWGIPGICVDQDNGTEVDCWDEDVDFKRYVPAFMVPDASIVTATRQDDGTSSSYYVLALEKEQRLKSVDATNCVSLTVDETLTLPTIDLWLDPTTGEMPVITAAPAVIGGVVQETPAE